jgi:hypothetical protein
VARFRMRSTNLIVDVEPKDHISLVVGLTRLNRRSLPRLARRPPDAVGRVELRVVGNAHVPCHQGRAPTASANPA